MYARILVPVDGSTVSDLALSEALKVAAEKASIVRVIHVVDVVTFLWDAEFVDIGEIQDSLRESARNILAKAARTAEDAHVRCETHLSELREGPHRTSNVIVDEARSWRADLIVLGTHGRRGLDRFLMGSVAEGVVRLAPVPVLLVPSPDAPENVPQG